MEYAQFKQLLQLKKLREKETVSLLEDFIDKFPYCQTSRLLYAKALHDQNNIHYDQNLKLAAAYAPDREVLRSLIETKTEETEFAFPLKKQQASAASTNEVLTSFHKKDERFEEWYSEDEISGRAFEEQREKEKILDPHEVIRRRLNEILGGSNQVQASDSYREDSRQAALTSVQQVGESELTTEKENKKAAGTLKKEPDGEKINVPETTTAPKRERAKTDAEEIVYKEDLEAEQKLEEEIISPTPVKSTEEKAILAQAEKARDVLDKLELEHAMEESILDSLEKLPVIAPEKKFMSPPEKEPDFGSVPEMAVSEDSPRTFTAWLKTIGKSTRPGFQEVRSTGITTDFQEVTSPPESKEDAESQLSDDELIEKFLLEDPKIEPSKAEFYSPIAQAKKSVMDHDDVVSETLAKIYLRQGNSQKARWCYEKLMLLHPEKSAFFAALLKGIDDQTNNKEDL